MGNSRWRLQTTLNYTALQVAELGREADVEILVGDWGSEIPLNDVLQLNPAASRIVSFLWIRPALAASLQGDSPFPEVLALNAAARRARGQYIGRIDQDTLVGRRFFKTFFELCDSNAPGLPTSLWYANRRSIHYRFAVLCPPLEHVKRFVRMFRERLPIWQLANRPFWTYWVGIWLAHRDIWHGARGYDERLIYYNWMEVEMIRRLQLRHELADMGPLVEHDFYHLEHASPHAPKGTRHIKKNADLDWNERPESFVVNDKSWGLFDYDLKTSKSITPETPPTSTRSTWAFVLLTGRTGVGMAVDYVAGGVSSFGQRWRHRINKFAGELRVRPLLAWPKYIMALSFAGKRPKPGA